MSMDGFRCECDRELRGKHDIAPCPIHGEKGKAAWERLEAQRDEARAERDEAHSRLRIQREQRAILFDRRKELETRYREALREIHAYLRLDGDQDHTKHGGACGQDACILCLCESVAASALSTPEQTEGE